MLPKRRFLEIGTSDWRRRLQLVRFFQTISPIGANSSSKVSSTHQCRLKYLSKCLPPLGGECRKNGDEWHTPAQTTVEILDELFAHWGRLSKEWGWLADGWLACIFECLFKRYLAPFEHSHPWKVLRKCTPIACSDFQKSSFSTFVQTYATSPLFLDNLPHWGEQFVK